MREPVTSKASRTFGLIPVVVADVTAVVEIGAGGAAAKRDGSTAAERAIALASKAVFMWGGGLHWLRRNRAAQGAIAGAGPVEKRRAPGGGQGKGLGEKFFVAIHGCGMGGGEGSGRAQG